MKISELLDPTEYTTNSDVSELSFSNISREANEIGEGTLFVLLPGVNYNTEKLLPLIFAKRPAAIITENGAVADMTDIPVLTVASARRTYAYLYARLYKIDGSTPKLIGITGTNGKTSTATMIEYALRENGRSVGFIGTGKIKIDGQTLTDRYYSMTTPDVELLYPMLKKMKDEGCEYVVMEVSSHALALEKLAPLRFCCGVFTNLSAEHLDFHKNMQDYYLAKRKLFSMCELAVINTDDAHGRRLSEECAVPVITVGALWDADARAQKIEDLGLSGVHFMYKHKALASIFKLMLPGIHNVYNATLAVTAVAALGGKPYLIRRALERLSHIDGRMQIVCRAPTVIIDYAHTERALSDALKTINSSKNIGQKIITVFGCGGERDREKRPKMATVAERYSDKCIVTSDNSRGEELTQIFKEILCGFSEHADFRVIKDRKCAIEYAILTAEDADIVYIGGKGHEKYSIDKWGYHDFDEEKIVSDVLKKRAPGYTVRYENTAK